MQPDLTEKILELIRRTSTDLPADVEERLRAAVEKEAPGSAARGALETVMKNVERSARIPARRFSMSIIPKAGARSS